MRKRIREEFREVSFHFDRCTVVSSNGICFFAFCWKYPRKLLNTVLVVANYNLLGCNSPSRRLVYPYKEASKFLEVRWIRHNFIYVQRIAPAFIRNDRFLWLQVPILSFVWIRRGVNYVCAANINPEYVYPTNNFIPIYLLRADSLLYS